MSKSRQKATQTAKPKRADAKAKPGSTPNLSPQHRVILTGARKLVANEKTWTKGVSARDVKGKEVGATSKAACRWCLIGAVHKETDKQGLPSTVGWAACDVLNERAIAKHKRRVVEVNDDLGRQAVLKLLDDVLG